MTEQHRLSWVFVSSFLLFLFLLLFYWRFGFLYLDGGYYLSAGRGVSQGKLPYRDFFFPQGPVYPYVYGLVQKVFGSSMQVARFTSLVFAVFVFSISFNLARRLGGWIAASVVAVVLGANSFIAYHFVVEKLNALAALLLLIGLHLFLRDTKRKVSFGPIFFLCLAATTRYTLLPALVVLFIWLFWQERHQPGQAILPLSAAVATLSLITVPFVLLCPAPFLYGIIGVHVSAAIGTSHHFGWVTKLGALSQLARFLTLLIGLTIPVLTSFCFKNYRTAVFPDPKEKVVWGMVGLISLAHFSANWFDASYQIVIIPVWTVLVGVGISRLLARPGLELIRKPMVGVLIVAALLTLAGQGREFVRLKPGGLVSPWIEDVAQQVQRLTGPGEVIITDQPLIAHQAQRDLVHGFEGAPFTYTPYWSTEQCLSFSTINDSLLREIIEKQEASLLALLPQSFRLASPGFVHLDDEHFQRTWRLISRYYGPVMEFKAFGGTTNTLTLYQPIRDD